MHLSLRLELSANDDDRDHWTPDWWRKEFGVKGAVRERFVLLFVVVAVFSLPATSHAEVMDKEFSLSAIWTASGTIAILGYLLGRYRIWAGIIAFVLAALFAWGQIAELIDPYVGAAIASEAGRSYFVQSYFASAIALIAPIAGVIRRRIRDSR